MELWSYVSMMKYKEFENIRWNVWINIENKFKYLFRKICLLDFQLRKSMHIRLNVILLFEKEKNKSKFNWNIVFEEHFTYHSSGECHIKVHTLQLYKKATKIQETKWEFLFEEHLRSLWSYWTELFLVSWTLLRLL